MVEQADDSQKKLVLLQTFSLHLICPIYFIYPTSPICSFFPPIPLLHPFHTSLLTYLIYSLYPACPSQPITFIPSLHSNSPFHLIHPFHPTCSSHPIISVLVTSPFLAIWCILLIHPMYPSIQKDSPLLIQQQCPWTKKEEEKRFRE